MKPTQLKSGAWRVKVYVGKDEQGKRKFVSVTRATKNECLRDAADIAIHHHEIARDCRNMTLGEAIDDYLESRSNILSPSTIRGYDYVRRLTLQGIINMKLGAITSNVAQKAINLEAKDKSPKTVSNIFGVLSVIMHAYCDRKLYVSLPCKQKKDYTVLTEAEIRKLIQSIQGHPCEIPVLLGLMLGLRRGEILGLRPDDYDRKNKIICIRRVMVEDKNSHFIEKPTPKTFTSNRDLIVPKYLADRIEAAIDSGHVLNEYSAARISKTLGKICEKNGIPKVTLHDLRRQNASVMLALGIADKYAMERGGWSTPNIMKSVYQMTMSDQRINVDHTVNSYFEQLAGSCSTKVTTP